LIVIVNVATLTAVGTIVIDPIYGILTETVTMIVLIHGMSGRALMAESRQCSPL
jgi:hypothetical protein